MINALSGGTLTVCQFVFSETMKRRVLPILTSRGCGHTSASGMQITGQLEVDLTRSTGAMHPSLPDYAGSGQELVSGMDQSI